MMCPTAIAATGKHGTSIGRLPNQAAERGHSKVCVNLTYLIDIVRCGPVDIPAAISWLRQATEAGDLLTRAVTRTHSDRVPPARP